MPYKNLESTVRKPHLPLLWRSMESVNNSRAILDSDSAMTPPVLGKWQGYTETTHLGPLAQGDQYKMQSIIPSLHPTSTANPETSVSCHFNFRPYETFTETPTGLTSRLGSPPYRWGSVRRSFYSKFFDLIYLITGYLNLILFVPHETLCYLIRIQHGYYSNGKHGMAYMRKSHG